MTPLEDASPEIGSAHRFSLSRSRFPSLSIGVLGCLAALVAFLHIHDSDAERDSLRFQRLVERVASRVADITRRYEYGLKGGRGLLAATDHVSSDEWERYVASHGLATEFPGALGFGIVRRVPRAELPDFEARIRAQGMPAFRVHSPGNSPVVLPITYIEPLERNLDALGQDIGLRPEEFEAAEVALRSGRPALTAPIPHLDGGDQWGFMYFVPCYERDAPIETEEQRRSALVGWIYAPIVMDRLLAGIAPQLEYQVDFEIFDESWTAARTPLYDWDGDVQGGAAIDALERREGRSFVASRTLEVGQRRWTVCVSSLPAFNASVSNWLGWVVLEGGVLVSLLLAVFVRWQHMQHARAEAQVEERTRELREKNRSLEAARERADAATRAKSEFLANMSHEIRTPMTAILGFAELMRDPRCTTQERTEYLRTIHSNGKRLLSVINDILDLSKVESGQMTVESLPCSPVAIVDDVVGLLAQRALAKGLALKVIWPEVLPERIMTDPGRARQVLVNLLGNALKFTEVGEVRIESSFEDESGAHPLWVCRVSDTGIGMSEQQLGEVFEPFTQADGSTTRRYGGSGLGLPISRKLAELLGGGLSAECEPGRGCTFIARIATGSLNGVRRISAMSLRDQRSDIAGYAYPRLAGRVLIAEDGADNRVLIKEHLVRCGLACVFASTGREALEAVAAAERESQPFDLILMDMSMPEMDGHQAAARLRNQGCTLPILALSASAMSCDRERCIAAGCDMYASKPIDGRTLSELCAQLLASRRAPTPQA